MTKSNRRTVRTMIGLRAGLLCAMLMAPDRGQAASISFNFTGSVGEVWGSNHPEWFWGRDGFTTALPVSGGITINPLARAPIQLPPSSDGITPFRISR